MDLYEAMTKIDLSNLFSEQLEHNGIQLVWTVQQFTLNGELQERKVLEKAHWKEKEQILQTLLQECKPLYEKLSLYEEYAQLRTDIELKDEYQLPEEYDEMQKAVMVARYELAKNPYERIKKIERIREMVFEDKHVAKPKLIYLANHAPTTEELYYHVKQTMSQNILVRNLNTTELQVKVVRLFKHVQLLFNTYKANPNETVILNFLTSELTDFYGTMKEIMGAIRGIRVANDYR
nr:hypothetical protein [Lysinibacillus timonensis]